ncbi:hypothetical protein L289_1455 [Acinetobacter gerneri DSM 14967 = CIP 107464 = MTCC 9824]|nr:hypothetical protein L289_1455 [Acinetobacter gerneri DSM 14967 = CIP 107464 = MTCC 9824]
MPLFNSSKGHVAGFLSDVSHGTYSRLNEFNLEQKILEFL